MRGRIVGVFVRRGMAAPAVGRRQRESFRREDVMGRFAVQARIPLPHRECLGGQNVMRLRAAVARRVALAVHARIFAQLWIPRTRISGIQAEPIDNLSHSD